MDKNLGISLIILTHNEEANLPKCLKSVEGLVSEIIIVDSGSTDGTKRIAEEAGAKFVVHEFKNQADQFNWALMNVEFKGDWILRLDADEELLPELKTEILEKLSKADANTGGFYIKRRNYFLGRWVRHGGYYPTWLLRIFRKGWGKSEEREMDEHLVLTQGTIEKLQNDFIDNNLKGLDEWREKHRKYAVREARAYLNNENKTFEDGEFSRNYRLKMRVYYKFPPFLRVILYFIYRYFFQLGFLDGWVGTRFHILQGFWYRWMVDVNILKNKKTP